MSPEDRRTDRRTWQRTNEAATDQRTDRPVRLVILSRLASLNELIERRRSVVLPPARSPAMHSGAGALKTVSIIVRQQ